MSRQKILLLKRVGISALLHYYATLLVNAEFLFTQSSTDLSVRE